MTARVTIAGLGPAGLDRLPEGLRRRLLDPDVRLVLRTLDHPAARELAAVRPAESADDLYETADTFDEVYRGIADRVLRAAADGPVIYAVPGSPMVGEHAVALLRAEADVELLPAESFLDLVLAHAGVDPLERGLQVLDGRELPAPLLLHLPTVIGQIDTA